MQRKMRKRLGSLPRIEASFIEPIECLSVLKLPKGSQSIWENWLDGYRALAIKSGKDVTLSSRRRSLYDYFAISWPKCLHRGEFTCFESGNSRICLLYLVKQ